MSSDTPGKLFFKNAGITALFLLLATDVAYLFFRISNNTTNVVILYLLATVLTAKETDGYLPGIAASVVSVLLINLVFTYPYMSLNFTLDGYPFTFLGMLVISAITSTLTAHLKEQNKILQKRDKLLMEAEKEKMRANLLRAVSHDLRTPLTSIIGASSSYLENTGSLSESDKRRLIQAIDDDANWLLHMVENLLSVTRISDQTAGVKTTLEPLEEVVPAAVSGFHKRLPQAQVQVQIPDEFVMVPMDATLIEQVLINLLENAVYHSGSSQPIELQAEVTETDAVFHVRDFGTGIDPQRLGGLFDGDTYSPGESSDSHKGMGIGLSICKTIITAHHGTIWAQNHSDGAEFIFTLPLGEQIYESETDSHSY